jgi:hypothetical protein
LEWIAQGAVFDGEVLDSGLVFADASLDGPRPDGPRETSTDAPRDAVPDVTARPDAPPDAPRDTASEPDVAPEAQGPEPSDAPPDVPDTTAPTPGTIASITRSACQTALVSWNAGRDDRTPTAQLSYDVCWAASPATCAVGSGNHLTVNGGGTSATIASLTVGTTYNVTVWTLDASGNRSAPSTMAFAVDGPPPLASVSMTPVSSTVLQASWTAPSSVCPLTYQLCWSTNSVDCGGGAFVNMLETSNTSVNIPGLLAHTTYFVFVRTANSATAVSDPVAASPTRTMYSFTTDVVPALNRCNASGCHGGANVVPTDYPSLLANEGGAQRATMTCQTLVVPGAPNSSFIYLTTQASVCGSIRMFLAANAADVDVILGWITDGAPND